MTSSSPLEDEVWAILKMLRLEADETKENGNGERSDEGDDGRTSVVIRCRDNKKEEDIKWKSET